MVNLYTKVDFVIYNTLHSNKQQLSDKIQQ